MRNERGMILATVMIIVLLVMVLTTAGLKMSELGYQAYGSEKKYQMAGWAAEYALNTGIDSVVSTQSCPGSSGNLTLTYGGVNVTYSYSSATGGNYCMIHASGSFGGAKVVKIAAVPKISSGYGALTIRNGGNMTVSGSSAIVNCTSTCKTPGVVFGGSITQNISGAYETTTCPNNPKGIYGEPTAVQDGLGNECSTTNGTCTATTLTDRIPEIFDSTDIGDLKNDLTKSYNGFSVDVTNLSVSSMPSIASAPSPACVCTNTGTFTLSTSTNSCTGVADFSACGGQIKFSAANVQINGIPSSISTIVSAGNVTNGSVTSTTGNFSDKSIYTTGTASITFSDSDITLNNSTIVSGGGITLSDFGTISNNTKIVSEGTAGITISDGTSIANSAIVSTNSSGNISMGGVTYTDSTIVSKNTLTIESTASTITNSEIFTNTLYLEKNSGGISGGILYAQGNATTQSPWAGDVDLGTSANPLLFIVGGNFLMDHGTGSADINGLLFVNGTMNMGATGNFDIKGAVVANSSTGTNTLSMTGNPQITFDSSILTTLSTNQSGLVKTPTCGGGGQGLYLSNNKVTIY